MKTAKKVFVGAMAGALLVAGSVAGTLAYLTDKTEEVKNTFTVGKVEITLDEADVNEYGVEIEGADRVTENEYKLIPGHNYVKDPTVHVEVESEPSYVFVKVENGLSSIEVAGEKGTIATQMGTKWTNISGTNVWYYNEIVDAREEAKDLLVFGEFTLADGAAVANYETATITIDAYAIQAEGFDDAADAWATAPATWTNGNN